MKLDNAIEVLTLENKSPWNHANSDLREAVKLGIEALKRTQQERKLGYRFYTTLLPGETEE